MYTISVLLDLALISTHAEIPSQTSTVTRNLCGKTAGRTWQVFKSEKDGDVRQTLMMVSGERASISLHLMNNSLITLISSFLRNIQCVHCRIGELHAGLSFRISSYCVYSVTVVANAVGNFTKADINICCVFIEFAGGQ